MNYGSKRSAITSVSALRTPSKTSSGQNWKKKKGVFRATNF